MNVGNRIRDLGFQRWYERTLLEGHAYLVTAILGLILALGGLEILGTRDDTAPLVLGIAVATGGALLVAFGMHRYLRILVLAQSLSQRATCTQCRTYAAFNVVDMGTSEGATPVSWLKVKCRRCGNEWKL